MTGIGIYDSNQSQHRNKENKDETKHRKTKKLSIIYQIIQKYINSIDPQMRE
jgi:hypothetical protein